MNFFSAVKPLAALMMLTLVGLIVNAQEPLPCGQPGAQADFDAAHPGAAAEREADARTLLCFRPLVLRFSYVGSCHVPLLKSLGTWWRLT